MKLLLLLVSVIAVFTADGRHNLPDVPDTVNGKPDFSDEAEIHDNVLANGAENPDYVDDNKQEPVVPESQESGNDEKHRKKINLADAEGKQILEFPEEESAYVESSEEESSEKESSDEEKEGSNERQVRRSRCKARNACVVMAGFCVTNATLCSGRLVPEGCKGTNCQCCVPGTLETKIHDLENEIQSMQTNLNSTKLNMNMTLQQLEYNIMDSFSNISSKLDYYMDHAGCPHDFFKAESDQCFMYFNTTRLNWTSAKARCQSEGLVIAKPNDVVALKRHIKDHDSGYHTWIGARGDGSNFKWDRDAQQISNSNSFWQPNNPGSSVSASYCLAISVDDSYPNQPVFAFSCSNARPFVCERVMN